MQTTPDIEHVCLAFAVITETAEDILGVPAGGEEMRFVAGAIMNRVRDGYRGRTVREVVLARAQYSRFLEAPARAALEADDPALAVMELIDRDRRYSVELYREALLIGAELLEDDAGNPWRNGQVDHPHAAQVHHYYSPVSMKPPGRRPSWWRDDREVLVPAIDSNRFRWAWGIA